jgi:preprotein translocase subunit YajC
LLGAPQGGSAGGSASGQMMTTFVTFGLVILIFYFLIIRPQNKKQKQTQKMIAALKKGDKVATIGGIRGTVTSVKEQTVVVKVDENLKIEFSKNAVASVLDKKQAKEEEIEDSEETEATDEKE